ncbi:gamma-glutamyl-gamma-aminobutyrate hydrolase family protein [Oceanobacillus caeni]|uniref:gamma-glutamyl-gamma-aminobutyrate hydrolase family protein n=1 Tax=Oceanobacillus caeni TaxID=405946 RepID=UPI0019597C15|nr:gamma-glutamyl-gamma-aminobutyrate hydrolase family protein [Oceanobacillus caeni]MBU8791475.1 gamma-glutamyl-gamma-aminobutyrate hydrolase family protein [Oceanobacillus caeni]
MKPFIGVTCSMEVDRSYYMTKNDNIKAIINAGGIPVILPFLSQNTDIEQIAKRIDGLYATGGYDIDPTLFGEEPHQKLGTIIPERDFFEIELTKKMLSMDKPILGICRGSQIINLAAGGDMYQDIYAQINDHVLQHTQNSPRDHGSHFVNVRKTSLLHQITNKKKIKVNSFHHQANRSVPKEFQISGVANDGVIEAIESKHHSFVLGVQWHPESMTDEVSMNIYKNFISACNCL